MGFYGEIRYRPAGRGEASSSRLWISGFKPNFIHVDVSSEKQLCFDAIGSNASKASQSSC